MRAKQLENEIKPVARSLAKLDRAKTAPIDNYFVSNNNNRIFVKNLDDVENDGDKSEYITSYNYYIYYHSLKPKDPRLPKPLYTPVPDMEFIKKGIKIENEILENNEEDRSNKGSSTGKDSTSHIHGNLNDFNEEVGLESMMSNFNLADKSSRSRKTSDNPNYYFDYTQNNQYNQKVAQFNSNFNGNFVNGNFQDPSEIEKYNFNFYNQQSAKEGRQGEDIYGFKASSQPGFNNYQNNFPNGFNNSESHLMNNYQGNKNPQGNQMNSMGGSLFNNFNPYDNAEVYQNSNENFAMINQNRMGNRNMNNNNNFKPNNFQNPYTNQDNFNSNYNMNNQRNYREEFNNSSQQQDNPVNNSFNSNQFYEQSPFGYNRPNMSNNSNNSINNFNNINNIKNINNFPPYMAGGNNYLNTKNTKKPNNTDFNFVQMPNNNTGHFSNFGTYKNQPNQGNPNRKYGLEVPSFDEILENIINLSKDHSGSRIVQRKYEEANEENKQRMFEILLPEILDLTKDVFGNYVVQKLLEFSSGSFRKLIFKELEGRINDLTTHMYGCRVIQKAIEYADVENVRLYLAELKMIIKHCIEDQNGNHVVQKLIEKLPQGEHGEIIRIISGKTYDLSIHQYGCRVIQRIFEHCNDSDKEVILIEIYKRLNELCFNQYGNYVVQHIIEKSKPNKITRIFDSVKGRIFEMSIHKFASNVIEKCLAYGYPTQKNEIISEIILKDDETNDSLLAMVKDKFGNYVVQKMIEVADNNIKELIIKRIITSQALKKRDGFSKHVVNFIEKMGFSANSLK